MAAFPERQISHITSALGPISYKKFTALFRRPEMELVANLNNIRGDQIASLGKSVIFLRRLTNFVISIILRL